METTKYTNREKKHLPTFISAWFFCDSQKEAMFIANSLTDTSEEMGACIVDEYINVKADIHAGNFLDLNLKQDKGFVYVINQEGTDFYKIGITKGMNGRLNNLQCGNPSRLSISFYGEFYYYKYLEKALHFKFSTNHHRGEWFKFTQKDIDNVIQRLEDLPTHTKNDLDVYE